MCKLLIELFDNIDSLSLSRTEIDGEILQSLGRFILRPKQVFMESKDDFENATVENGTQSNIEDSHPKRKILCSVCEADLVKIVSEDSSIEINASNTTSSQTGDVKETENTSFHAMKRRRSVGDQKTSFSSRDEAVYHEQAQISRYFLRRGALCNPEKMAMSQTTREGIEDDVQRRRRSVKRKLNNFLTTRLDLDREEDLF